MNFAVNQAHSAGLIDQQSSALPLYHGRPHGSEELEHCFQYLFRIGIFLGVCYFDIDKSVWEGGIRGTVVSRWTTNQQVERLILRQGHDFITKFISFAQAYPAQHSHTVQNRGLNH